MSCAKWLVDVEVEQSYLGVGDPAERVVEHACDLDQCVRRESGVERRPDAAERFDVVGEQLDVRVHPASDPQPFRERDVEVGGPSRVSKVDPQGPRLADEVEKGLQEIVLLHGSGSELPSVDASTDCAGDEASAFERGRRKRLLDDVDEAERRPMPEVANRQSKTSGSGGDRFAVHGVTLRLGPLAVDYRPLAEKCW